MSKEAIARTERALPEILCLCDSLDNTEWEQDDLVEIISDAKKWQKVKELLKEE